MPNWNSNTVTFRHEDTAQIERVIKAYNDSTLFNEFVPVPEALQNTEADGMTTPERTAMREQYGYADWYEFCVNEWGTKWDISNDYGAVDYTPGQTEVSLSFNTAWSPPDRWFEKMYEDHGFGIKAYYYEPGMAFCGIWEDGDDDQYEIEGDSQWVEDHIPQSLNEMFSIAETMANYEEEQQMDDETYAADEPEQEIK